MFNQPSNERNVSDLLDKVEKLAYEKGRSDATAAMASKNTFAARVVGGVILYFAVAITISYAQDIVTAYKAKVKRDLEEEAVKA